MGVISTAVGTEICVPAASCNYPLDLRGQRIPVTVIGILDNVLFSFPKDLGILKDRENGWSF